MSKVIIFPTDTVYGLGTPIFDVEGIKRIYEIKHRPKDKPLACLCASLEQIESIAYVPENAKKLIKRFLPGALTIILNSKEEVIEKIGYKTIGVRIPNAKIALDILNENGPMLTTSVNESGMVPENEYDDILRDFGSLVDKVYETDRKSSSVPSTVLMINQDGSIKILRNGEITGQEIEECLA
ncbi:MAG: threonylcarbamoyl-AMP synthase [Acholeplasmatales bacterium]|nr:threonylcarbamoyl-AMP synthase [Acholeplasmatales bacterium]